MSAARSPENTDMDPTARMDRHDKALVRLGRLLREDRYHFTTVTPLTHKRVNARPENRLARSTEDVFGWNRPFEPDLMPREILDLLDEAGCLAADGTLLRSTVRFSSLGAQLFVHSSFPTDSPDAVFFGPDTYRFVRALHAELAAAPAEPMHIVDVGCGSGAGGLAVMAALPFAAGRRLTLGDINTQALRCAAVNAAINGIAQADIVESDVLGAVTAPPDLIIANPPYLLDDAQRLYRHGGGSWGEGLSLRILREAVARLKPNGRLMLYTGSAIVNGVDKFQRAAREELDRSAMRFGYAEIDPDVFGEELERPDYQTVDRLAAVLLTVTKN